LQLLVALFLLRCDFAGPCLFASERFDLASLVAFGHLPADLLETQCGLAFLEFALGELGLHSCGTFPLSVLQLLLTFGDFKCCFALRSVLSLQGTGLLLSLTTQTPSLAGRERRIEHPGRLVQLVILGPLDRASPVLAFGAGSVAGILAGRFCKRSLLLAPLLGRRLLRSVRCPTFN
jgi:hypothetical protein